MIIDTHTHFYDPTRPAPPGRDRPIPWPSPGTALYRPILPPRYLEIARPLGITGTVVVEASRWIEDNQWLLDLAERHKVIVGVIGNLNDVLGTERFDEIFTRMARQPLFRGIRIGERQVAAALVDGTVAANLRRLADEGLVVELLKVPLDEAARLADRMPTMRIVLNHMGAVELPTPPVSWFSGIESVAKRPNVFVKVAGLVDAIQASGGNAPTDLAPYRSVLDHVFRTFGADRVLYGTNWPVSESFASLAVIHSIVSRYLATKSPEVAQKVFWRNSLAVYRWIQRK